MAGKKTGRGAKVHKLCGGGDDVDRGRWTRWDEFVGFRWRCAGMEITVRMVKGGENAGLSDME
jgi:hypothetical protein